MFLKNYWKVGESQGILFSKLSRHPVEDCLKNSQQKLLILSWFPLIFHKVFINNEIRFNWENVLSDFSEKFSTNLSFFKENCLGVSIDLSCNLKYLSVSVIYVLCVPKAFHSDNKPPISEVINLSEIFRYEKL